MFPRISAFLTVAIAVAASARMERHAHVRRDTTPTGGQCNTGNIKCCNNVANATDLASILDLLSYSYDPADSVGIDCTPFNIYGAGESATCQQQPVCCSNNTYDGTLSFNVGCSPMNLN